MKDPNLITNQTSLTSFQFWGDKTPSHAVSDDKYRYISYGNGFEELYHLEKDPHEFKNLASDENYTEIKNKLKISIPKSAAKIRKIPKQLVLLYNKPLILLQKKAKELLLKMEERHFFHYCKDLEQ